MTNKREIAPLDASEIAAIVGMQMRREIDAFRARESWCRILASTPAEVVVEGLVLALSVLDLRPLPPTALTINVAAGSGVSERELVERIAALVGGCCRGLGS